MADRHTKVCNTCGQEKPRESFRVTPYTKDRITNRCKVCQRAIDRANFAAKPPEVQAAIVQRQRQRSSERYHTIKNNAEFIEARKEYARRNSASICERVKQWQKDNPERFRHNSRASEFRRRSLLKDGATGPETKAWFEVQPKRCHWCGCDCSRDPVIDHIHPLSKGGKHELRNLAVSCRSCNARKNAKDPLDFAREVGRLL